MDTLNLTTLADEELAAARSARSGRTARTIHGGRQHALRQTVIALTGGSALADHHSPGEPTLQVCTAASASPPPPTAKKHPPATSSFSRPSGTDWSRSTTPPFCSPA